MANQNIWALDRNELSRQKRRSQTTAFFLNPAPSDFILDVGCSEGFVANHLLRAAFVVGLDASKDALLIAKQKLSQPNIDFILADATALPLRTAAFNKATALEVLEHLPVERQKSLCSEVDRILRQMGTLIVSVPYREQISYTRCIHCGKLTPLWGHVESMDEEKVTALLPRSYVLTARCFLPNVGFISMFEVFGRLPFKMWFALNNLLGKLHKGYWILLRYEKGKTKA
jgi:ubiquinone/menaquinone biosynthesis C-methylase UbiE